MDPNTKNIETYKGKDSVKHYTTTEMNPIEKVLIEKYFKSPVLDLGCGVGRTTKYLHDKKFNVTGVEIIEEMVKKAKEIYPKIDFKVGNACKLKFNDNSFKTVFFSFNGLDYIFPEQNRIKALREIERVLMKNGHFIFSSHNPTTLFFRFRPRFILRNIKNKSLFSKYKLEAHSFGDLHTYYCSPKKQIKMVENNTSLKFVGKFISGIKDLHPHYVFRK